MGMFSGPPCQAFVGPDNGAHSVEKLITLGLQSRLHTDMVVCAYP